MYMKMNMRGATVIRKFSYPEINSDNCNTKVFQKQLHVSFGVI